MASIVNTSRIAVVGLGQLGTSLAMKFKELGCREMLAVTRNEAALKQAVDDGILNAGSTDAEDILPVVDIVFLCTPLRPSIQFVKDNLQHFRFGSLVTDVSSVKAPIVEAIRPLLFQHGTWFIGSHPMAGSEKSGFDVGRADLYEKAVTFITPTEEDDTDAIRLLRQFWEALGALPIEMTPERHDQACAYSSHIGHLITAGLVKATLGQGDCEANAVACATGFKDTTRIASGNVNMWADICRLNKGAISRALTTFQDQMEHIKAAIEKEDWEAVSNFLQDGKSLRDTWMNTAGKDRGYTT